MPVVTKLRALALLSSSVFSLAACGEDGASATGVCPDLPRYDGQQPHTLTADERRAAGLTGDPGRRCTTPVGFAVTDPSDPTNRGGGAGGAGGSGGAGGAPDAGG
jgi:hypothetical protein